MELIGSNFVQVLHMGGTGWELGVAGAIFLVGIRWDSSRSENPTVNPFGYRRGLVNLNMARSF